MVRNVVLVDEQDKELGTAEIFAAHANPGKLHRAISVLLWRKQGDKREVLIQQRSEKKPLWPKYWANTVCTHPFPGEKMLDCAYRRLKEEMGIEMNSGLREVFEFNYRADFDERYSECEHDHVVVGEWDGRVVLNPEEVRDYRWVGIEQLKRELSEQGDKFAPWIKLIINAERLGIRE